MTAGAPWLAPLLAAAFWLALGLVAHSYVLFPWLLARWARGKTLSADVWGPAAADLPWVMEPRGAASRHWAEQACRLAVFEPDVRFSTADLQAQTRLVESGNAVALMPDLMWAGGDSPCRLVDLPTGPRRTVFTSIRGASAHRPAILALRAALETVAAGLAGRME